MDLVYLFTATPDDATPPILETVTSYDWEDLVEQFSDFRAAAARVLPDARLQFKVRPQ